MISRILIFDNYDNAFRLCINCHGKIRGKRSDAIYCCHDCGEKYRKRRHYNKNPQHYKKKRGKDNSDAPTRIWYRAKSRAKKYSIPFNLSAADIIVPDYCPVLGIPIKKANQGKGYHPDSASLDRIYPEKGYIVGNVRVVSARANLLKSDASIEELEAVLKDLKEIWGYE